MFFKNRGDAGIKLSKIVLDFSLPVKEWDIVGIARGGVIIANEIARALESKPKAICIEEMELDKDAVLVASSTGCGIVFDGDYSQFVPSLLSSKKSKIRRFAKQTYKRQISFARRNTAYKKNVLICDDGVVSARTLITAVLALRHYGVKKVVAAIPVVTSQLIDQSNFPIIAWRITKMKNPATGIFYYSFDDVEDSEVVSILS